MLVLTRKLGEAIRIGDDVELYVVGVSRGKVKLGFRAPRNIAVQRLEIADQTAAPAPMGASRESIVSIGDRHESVGTPPLRVFRSASGA